MKGPMKTLGGLKANPKNPRTITDKKLAMLKGALDRFGDLGCIVYNRKTKRLVGGHQRSKALPPEAKINIMREYDPPTKKGTVAVGYARVNGERFAYREVAWDDEMEAAANIAANKGAGEWDLPQLAGMMADIESMGFDLDLTMFDDEERMNLANMLHEPNFEAASEEDQGKLDEKKKTVCPHCGESFLVGGRK